MKPLHKPMRSLARARRKSAGIGIVTAIFLLVVLAGLGVAIVSLSTTQQASATQDQQGARAYQAARAGIEWALYIGLQTGYTAPNPPVPATTLGCPRNQAGGVTFQLPPDSVLHSFWVTVTCGTVTTVGTTQHFWIRSTACNEPNVSCPNTTNPSVDYVQRVVEVQL
jgi:MSHA biogenesis protein MshP